MIHYAEVLKDAKVEREAIRFSNQGIKLAGNIFRPAEERLRREQYPAIVIGHPSGGVKEQTAGVYAIMLAERGFLTLVFDASYQGESGGEPRFLESPAARIEDLRCAVDYLTTREDVDAEKIGVLGMCAGGGFAIKAAETDLRMKAIATVSMADLGDLFRNGLERKMKRAELRGMLEQISEQRTREANGDSTFYAGYVPNTEEETIGKQNDYRQGYEYYRKSPAKHPNSPNKFIFSRADAIINFTALDHVELLAPRPLLIIAGTKANTRYFSEEAYDKAGAPKEIFWVDGATHIELYYKKAYVEAAIDKLNKFFTEVMSK